MAGEPNPLPGDPARLRDLARKLRDGAWTLGEVRAGMARLGDARDQWDGPAAQEFRRAAGGLPPQLQQVATRFERVATALVPYADVLEQARRDAGQAAIDRERAMTDLQASAAVRDQLRRTSPGGAPLIAAERDVQRAADAVADANRAIDAARRRLRQAADGCANAIRGALADGLRDVTGPMAGLRRHVRGYGDAVAANPLMKLLGAVTPPSIAMGLASSEGGRDALETVSDWVNVLGAVAGVASLTPAAPIAAPIGAGLGALGLVIDGSLYAHGRKNAADLRWDMVGFTPGGGAAKGYRAIGGLFDARAVARAAEAEATSAKRAIDEAWQLDEGWQRVRWGLGDPGFKTPGWEDIRAGFQAVRRDIATAEETNIVPLHRAAGVARANLRAAIDAHVEAAREGRRFQVDAAKSVAGLIPGGEAAGSIWERVRADLPRAAEQRPIGLPENPVLMGAGSP